MYNFLFDSFKKEDLIDFFGDEISYWDFIYRLKCYDVAQEYLDYGDYFLSLFDDKFKNDCLRFTRNLRMRKLRCKKRISRICKNNAVFLTFTISNEFINLKYNTYVRKIKEILNGYDYVANADFGELNGRLHFHVVVSTNNFKLNSWPYGSTNVLKVKNNSDSLAVYISKLSNHALKYSSYKTIYGRKKRS